jgi:signal transduction histidine kinase
MQDRLEDQHREAERRPVDVPGERDRLVAMVEVLSDELADRTRELAQSEGRFRDVIDHVADELVVVDLEGYVRYAKRAATRLFGKTRDELIGELFGFPVVAEETTEVDVVAGRGPRVAEMRAVRSQWEGGAAYIASLRDVTDRKQAEAHARELIREQSARSSAEESARRLRFLLDSSTRLTASLDYRRTFTELARLCAADMADWAVVYDLDDAGRPRRVAVAHRDPEKASLARELRDMAIDSRTANPLLEVLRTRQPVVVPHVDPTDVSMPTFNTQQPEIVGALGITSFMLVPMIARDRPLGVLGLMCGDPHPGFGDQDLALAADIAHRAALAVDNARLFGEAQQAVQTKSDFLAVVSHDLRTPLNAIIGYTELLDIGIPNPLPDSARKHLERVRNAAKHLLYLLNELLAFARLDAGHEEVRLTDADMRAVVREVVDVIEPVAREQHLGVEVSVPDTDVRVRTDTDKLRQLLLNIASNAVKYTERGGIRLELRSADDVTIRVIDSGPGIAPENLERIFEPFWQVDPTRRSSEGGTGLGLSIVRRLSALLGMTVSVDSTVGKGTTFTVRIPVQPLSGTS